jgi:hypothetical protein
MRSMLSRIKKVKKKIKTALESLPFGLGLNVVVPLAKWLLAIFVYRNMISNFRRRLIIKSAAFKIRKACKNPDIKDFVVCFDLSVSALGFGEVFYSVMLARYAVLHQKKIRFVFIDGKLRHDFAEIYSNIALFNKHFEAMRLIPTTLLDEEHSLVQCMPWNDFQKSIDTDFVEQGSMFIAMSDFVRRREPTYNNIFNILNSLLSYESIYFRDKFLLNYDELSKLTGISRPECEYITMGVRYSLLWSESRNLDVETFKVICSYLFKKYPAHKLMVVSDDIGCNYFRELSHNMDLDLLFSKDYSLTYLGDGALILGSAFYFQFMGGGIGVIPMFSNVSYEITCPLANELMWSTRRLMSWQGQSQFFNVSNELKLF